LDARADLYSVGILFYKTLTGRMPFEGSKDIELMTAHVKTEPKPPSASNPAVPAAIDAIVRKALRKNPDERYASARQFSDAIAATLDTTSSAGARPGASAKRKAEAAIGATK
jgi:serine/threonine-protein kinase